jgi:2-oxoglutarate ferredoxin oxidoreductase subunit beta
VYQPCVTFNKVNTYQWFRERVYKLDESHNKEDIKQAVGLTVGNEKIPTGVLYEIQKPTYEESLSQLETGSLVEQTPAFDFKSLIDELV